MDSLKLAWEILHYEIDSIVQMKIVQIYPNILFKPTF